MTAIFIDDDDDDDDEHGQAVFFFSYPFNPPQVSIRLPVDSNLKGIKWSLKKNEGESEKQEFKKKGQTNQKKKEEI